METPLVSPERTFEAATAAALQWRPVRAAYASCGEVCVCRGVGGVAHTPSPITCTKATSEVGWSGVCGGGGGDGGAGGLDGGLRYIIPAQTTVSRRPTKPAGGSSTYAGGSGEEGVRGVTLAPGCANSRRVTFYR